MSDVTVVGMGAMGTALAGALIAAEQDVVVWNRSPEKMTPLIAIGARAATSLADAITASRQIIICLSDYQTTNQLFNQPDMVPLLNGRTLIQLGTSTPNEAETCMKWFNDHGAAYLDGTILCWPGDIGTPSGQISVAGAESAFADSQSSLSHLAGNLRYLGSNIRAPATIEMAFLSRVLGIIFGSIHGALICEAEGVPVSEFTEILPPGDRAIPLTQAINDGTFETISAAGASVDVAVGCAMRLQQQARDAGINSELPDLLWNWAQRAKMAGYGPQESAAIIKVIRGTV